MPGVQLTSRCGKRIAVRCPTLPADRMPGAAVAGYRHFYEVQGRTTETTHRRRVSAFLTMERLHVRDFDVSAGPKMKFSLGCIDMASHA
jgi:hypothetical protein